MIENTNKNFFKTLNRRCLKESLGVTGTVTVMRPRSHRFKSWKQPLVDMQGQVVYDRLLRSDPSLDLAHSGSFSVPKITSMYSNFFIFFNLEESYNQIMY